MLGHGSTTILLAARLAIQMGCNKSQATSMLYQRLSLSLVRANARALLSHARFRHSEEVWVWGGYCCDIDFVGVL